MVVALSIKCFRDECSEIIENKSATPSSQIHGEGYSLTWFVLLLFSLTYTLYKPVAVMRLGVVKY